MTRFAYANRNLLTPAATDQALREISTSIWSAHRWSSCLFFFGYQKQWPYEAERHAPFISYGPPIWDSP